MRDKPKILGSEWIWEGFEALTTCRQLGMGVGPIPWTARVRYAEVNQFDADMRERFFAGIKVMDEVFVEEVNDGDKK